jgi:hypothetical protein
MEDYPPQVNIQFLKTSNKWISGAGRAYQTRLSKCPADPVRPRGFSALWPAPQRLPQ